MPRNRMPQQNANSFYKKISGKKWPIKWLNPDESLEFVGPGAKSDASDKPLDWKIGIDISDSGVINHVTVSSKKGDWSSKFLPLEGADESCASMPLHRTMALNFTGADEHNTDVKFFFLFTFRRIFEPLMTFRIEVLKESMVNGKGGGGN